MRTHIIMPQAAKLIANPSFEGWMHHYLQMKQVRLAHRTQAYYKSTLTQFYEFLGGRWPPTIEDILAYLEEIPEEKQIRRYTHYAHIRAFLRYVTMLGGLESNPAEMIRDLRLAPSRPKDKPKAVPSVVLDRMDAYFANQEQTPKAIRDRALFGLLRGCGCRSGEAAGLTFDRLDMADQSLYVPARIAKNRQGRTVFFSNAAADRLRTWLDCMTENQYSGRFVFPSLSPFYRLLNKPIHRDTVNRLWRRHLAAAGEVHYSVHAIRHAFGFEAVSRGVPLPSLQKQMGHSSIEMTARYAMYADRQGHKDFAV